MPTIDPARYLVRPLSEGDYEAVAGIERTVTPELPFSAEDLRRWERFFSSGTGRLSRLLAAEERSSGEMVGFGTLQHTPFNFDPQKFRLTVKVAPGHRGRGLGRELYSRLEEEAVTHRAVCLWSSCRQDDPRSLRFLECQGFVPNRKNVLSRLDLPPGEGRGIADRTEELSRSGVRVTTLAAEGADRREVREQYHRVSMVAAEDMPRMGEHAAVPYEEFVGFSVESPSSIPEATFLAYVGPACVGVSSLEREFGDPRVLRVGFTGTDPDFRGRGIASELKRRAVKYAADHGYAALLTNNDSRNAAILTLNERLGFRPVLEWLQGEKLLDDRRG